jgi:YHS domain-containing protein
MMKDPICGMMVDEKNALAKSRTSEYKGQTFYFCAVSCKAKFDSDPEKYSHSKTSH